MQKVKLVNRENQKAKISDLEPEIYTQALMLYEGLPA
jgi:hypothetical protein